MEDNALITLSKSLTLYDSGNKEEALQLIYSFISQENKKTLDRNIYDLAMEIYIFFIDGDLREKGRDFGFANTGELKSELEKLKI